MPQDKCYCARCKIDVEVICPGCDKTPAQICMKCIGTGRSFVFQFSEKARKRTSVKRCERCKGRGFVD